MSNHFIQRGGLWVVGQFLLLLAVAIFGIASRAPSSSVPTMVCGLAFLAISIICGFAGTIALGRSLTPFPKPAANAQFVQQGIYALIRHPLYTAVFCFAVGWSLIWQSPPALTVSLALGAFFDAKARREERWLREKFPDYAGYERRVRRFIPWLY